MSRHKKTCFQVIGVLSVVFLLDLVPFLISRYIDLLPVYSLSKAPFSQVIFSIFILVVNIMLLASITFAIRGTKRVKVKIPDKLLLVSGSLLTLYLSYILNGFSPSIGGFRYQSGGFQGTSIVLYSINLCIFYFCMFWYSKNRNADDKSSSLLSIYLLLQLLLVDGIGPLITLVCAWIICGIRVQSHGRLTINLVAIAFLVFSGMVIKFLDFESGQFDRSFMDIINWLVGRLALRYESYVMWLNNEAYISNILDYYNLLLTSLRYRVEFLFGIGLSEFPKSLSEAIFYDLYGFGGSGSSPGFNYGLVISGMGGGVLPIMMILFMKQYFWDLNARLNLMYILVYGWIFGQIYADIFELQIILSPAFGIFASFILAALCTPSKRKNNDVIK
jgi:hypothetical protein